MKAKLMALSLLFLLTGCAELIDDFSAGVYDNVLDNVFDVAVDTLLETNDDGAVEGNTAPPPPENLAVPEQVDRFYNDIYGDGVYQFAVFGEQIVTMGGGWEVTGMIMRESTVDSEAVASVYESPTDSKFSYSFQDYDGEGTLIYHTVECKSTGTTSHDSVYFNYSLNGNTVERTLKNSGVVGDDSGYIVYEPFEMVTFFIPFGCEMMDKGEVYTNITDYYENRAEADETFAEGRGSFHVALTVEESVVVSMVA